MAAPPWWPGWGNKFTFATVCVCLTLSVAESSLCLPLHLIGTPPWYGAAVKLEASTLRLSATDLANHLACRHLTALDRGAAEGRWKPPDWYRPEADVLRQRGFEHERGY